MLLSTYNVFTVILFSLFPFQILMNVQVIPAKTMGPVKTLSTILHVVVYMTTKTQLVTYVSKFDFGIT